MDWTHLAIAVGEALVAGGVLKRSRKKSKKREKDAGELAKAAVKAAAEHAARQALEELEKKAVELAAEWERQLARLSPGTAGGALLTRLQAQRDLAIQQGKLEAMRTYREKMQD